jgi:nicotinamide riboside transporter PnuC
MNSKKLAYILSLIIAATLGYVVATIVYQSDLVSQALLGGAVIYLLFLNDSVSLKYDGNIEKLISASILNKLKTFIFTLLGALVFTLSLRAMYNLIIFFL